MQNFQSDLDAALRRELIRIVLERVQGASIENAIEIMEFDSSNIPGAKCDVEEHFNRAYMNKSEVPLAMDVFFPKMPKGTELPVIINIHGGGLVMGDRKMSRAYGHVLASRGYLVFNIEYRLAPRANVAEQLDDVCAGMDAIASHLIDFEVDFDRIFLTAASAGWALCPACSIPGETIPWDSCWPTSSTATSARARISWSSWIPSIQKS